MEKYHGTTIVSVRNSNSVALGGDGQVSIGNTIFKATANKIRSLYKNKVLAGFAGSTSDALTLFEMFESKLEEHQGDLLRSAINFGKFWRNERNTGKLEALMCVANIKITLVISGNGDVVIPDKDIIAIGSGGQYARASAEALRYNTNISPKNIVKKSLEIASNICVFTNKNLTIKELKKNEENENLIKKS